MTFGAHARFASVTLAVLILAAGIARAGIG
jgi:hypothetical protein